ncbi:MAG: hypothetical protein ABII82_16785 [Verrucomicrobiota bacterium]
MSHDPLAQIDQQVLAMIEQSPVGAVPHTPTYQDGLRRLIAAHQVYASADHKDGYVTVRSLAALPLFHAQNLDALIAGQIAFEELEADGDIFNRYVLSLPESLRAKAEARRADLVAGRIHHRHKTGDDEGHDPRHSLFLIPGGGPNPGLPGNYLHGSVYETDDASGTPWALQVHDSLDGVSVYGAASPAEALEKLQEVLASAPLLLGELDALGFEAR